MFSKLFGAGLAMLVAVAAGSLFFGWDTVATTAAAWRSRMVAAAEEAKSDEQQLAEIRVRIDRLKDERARAARELAKHDVTLGRYQEQARRLGVDLERGEDALYRARKLLDSKTDKDQFLIAGRTYTRQQLSDDAVARVERCKALRTQLQHTEQQIGQLERALREGQATLVQADQQTGVLENRLETLQVRVAAGQLREQLAELTPQSATLERTTTRLTEALDRLELQVEVSERQDEASASIPISVEVVDCEGRWENSEDAREKIDEYFEGT